MKDLLNPAQKKLLRIILRRFEENFLRARAWLVGNEENGVLHQRKPILPAKRRQEAEQEQETKWQKILFKLLHYRDTGGRYA